MSPFTTPFQCHTGSPCLYSKVRKGDKRYTVWGKKKTKKEETPEKHPTPELISDYSRLQNTKLTYRTQLFSYIPIMDKWYLKLKAKLCLH